MDLSGEIERNEVSAQWKDVPLKVMDLHCGRNGDDSQCDRHCKKINIQRYNVNRFVLKKFFSTGRCVNETTPQCECTSCVDLMCDFDGDKECGWTDLRLLSQQFNNISIAAKKDRRK